MAMRSDLSYACNTLLPIEQIDNLISAAIRAQIPARRLPGYDPEDLLGECRLAVLAGLDRFCAASGAISTWITAIARNCLRDLVAYVGAARRAASGCVYLAEIPEIAAPDDPEEQAIMRITAAEIWKLAQTQEEENVLIGLGDGQTLRQIARDLGITRQRVARVRNSLQRRAQNQSDEVARALSGGPA